MSGTAGKPERPKAPLRLPNLAGVEQARTLLRAHIPETPLVRSELLSRAFATEVWLKNETVTPIASFKLRGALTALLRGHQTGRAVEAVTSSTGNHGQGVAYAARATGGTAHIFLPLGANPVKRRMIEALGAIVHEGGADIDDAKAYALRFAVERGGLFVDDGESLDMMEGAGTVGLEVAERLPGVDVMFVPMGSGTLSVGCAVGLKGVQPGARVVAVQSKGSSAMVESFHARRAVERAIDTVADGLVCRVPALLALEGLWAWVDDAVAVPDAELLRGIRTLVEHAHVLVEPAGAAALAAAWAARADLRGRRVVLVLTGANVTMPVLETALSKPAFFDPGELG
jgi:threonine dehydratase